MCGRFALWADREAIEARFRVRLKNAPTPRYNIAPSQDILAIRGTRDHARKSAHLRWGLVPHWARGPNSGYRMINARSESVFDKPAYRSAIRRRRCLIPASAFFEWKRSERGKQPYRIRVLDAEIFSLAGIWERWTNEASQEMVESCAILTTRANGAVRELHDRMPVIIQPESEDLWLDPALEDPKSLRSLLEPYSEKSMEVLTVSRSVNNPANDNPSVARPLEG